MSRGSARATGFTLTEMIIVSALAMILGGALITIFLTGQASYLSADSYIQVHQEARRALDAMVRELREAKVPGVTFAAAPALNFQIALGFDLNGTYAACPDNEVCWGAVDSTGTLQPDWTIRYSLSGTQLVRQLFNGGVAQGALRVLANQVDAADTSFAWNADASVRTVTIKIRVRDTNSRLPGGSMATNILTSQVRLRNPD